MEWVSYLADFMVWLVL